MTPAPSDPPPSCSSCRFWGQPRGPAGHHYGDCRRHAPGPGGAAVPGVGGAFGAWPLTMAGSWCGDHQPRGDRS